MMAPAAPAGWCSQGGAGAYHVDASRGAGTRSRSPERGLPHPEPKTGEQINSEQRLTVAEGLRAQTVNAAYAGFQEAKLGTLEPGRLADVAVLGDDPFRFPPERFGELPVDLTIVGGRIVYQREGVSAAVGR
jgi:hypothetical protein